MKRTHVLLLKSSATVGKRPICPCFTWHSILPSLHIVSCHFHVSGWGKWQIKLKGFFFSFGHSLPQRGARGIWLWFIPLPAPSLLRMADVAACDTELRAAWTESVHHPHPHVDQSVWWTTSVAVVELLRGSFASFKLDVCVVDSSLSNFSSIFPNIKSVVSGHSNALRWPFHDACLRFPDTGHFNCLNRSYLSLEIRQITSKRLQTTPWV